MSELAEVADVEAWADNLIRFAEGEGDLETDLGWETAMLRVEKYARFDAKITGLVVSLMADRRKAVNINCGPRWMMSYSMSRSGCQHFWKDLVPFSGKSRWLQIMHEGYNEESLPTTSLIF